MKSILLLSLFLLSTLQASAQMRTFTDKQGRTMEAELINVVGSQVRLKRADGAAFNVAPTVFSEEDQAFIQLWMLRKLNERDNLLTTSAKSSKTRPREASPQEVMGRESQGIEFELWEALYKVSLENESDLTLKDFRAEYRIHILRSDLAAQKRNQGKPEIISGKIDLPPIAPHATFEFETVKAKMLNSALKPGWVYSEGGDRESEDQIEGFRIRIYFKDELLVDWANPTSLLKNRW